LEKIGIAKKRNKQAAHKEFFISALLSYPAPKTYFPSRPRKPDLEAKVTGASAFLTQAAHVCAGKMMEKTE
jgi:hypothetical protein